MMKKINTDLSDSDEDSVTVVEPVKPNTPKKPKVSKTPLGNIYNTSNLVCPMFEPGIPKSVVDAFSFMMRTGFDKNTVLCDIRDIKLKKDDMKLLSDNAWLNDDVVNSYVFYLSGINNKVLLFPCTFLNQLFGGEALVYRYKELVENSYSRYQNLQMFDYDVLLLPVNLVIHWVFFKITFSKNAFKISYYDSLPGHIPESKINKMMKMLEQWIGDLRSNLNMQGEFRLHSTHIRRNKRGGDQRIPQQNNGNDCGVFMLEMMRRIVMDKPFNLFSPVHIPHIRKRIFMELTQDFVWEKVIHI